MTSKEALDELRNVLNTNPGTKGYVDIFENHLLKPIEKDLVVLALLKSQIVCKGGTTTTFNTRDYRIKEWLENGN